MTVIDPRSRPDGQERDPSFLKSLENDDREYVRELLRTYYRMKTIIRAAEAACINKRNTRDYYAYCTLVAQQREIISDLRDLADPATQAERIISNVLQPLVSSIGQDLITAFYQQKALVQDLAPERQTQFAIQKLDQIVNRLSESIQGHYTKSAQRMYELVSVREKPKKKTTKRRTI